MRELVKQASCLVIAGLSYYLFVKATGISIPCIFYTITDLQCPGCGITTMCIALMKGDLQTARNANGFLFYTLPFFILLIIWRAIATNKGRSVTFCDSLLLGYLISLISFGVYRNL